MARVLVIDDDHLMRRLIHELLAAAGHEVAEARDGVEGVRLFETQAFDLVVVDIYLPEQDGWNTLRAMFRSAPGIPFILVSGGPPLEGLRKGQPGVLDSARQAGAYRVLRKPFPRQALADAVRELLPARS
jgi:CheY-like chemotaxis protein